VGERINPSLCDNVDKSAFVDVNEPEKLSKVADINCIALLNTADVARSDRKVRGIQHELSL
jgi:hypothetical protein